MLFFLCVYVCIWYVRVYGCMYVYMHVCTCLYVCTGICMHACTCVYECMHMLINNMHVVRAWTRRSEVDVRCLPLLFSTQYLETVFLWICKCWSSDGKVFWQSGVKKYHKVTVSLQFRYRERFPQCKLCSSGWGGRVPWWSCYSSAQIQRSDTAGLGEVKISPSKVLQFCATSAPEKV